MAAQPLPYIHSPARSTPPTHTHPSTHTHTHPHTHTHTHGPHFPKPTHPKPPPTHPRVRHAPLGPLVCTERRRGCERAGFALVIHRVPPSASSSVPAAAPRARATLRRRAARARRLQARRHARLGGLGIAVRWRRARICQRARRDAAAAGRHWQRARGRERRAGAAWRWRQYGQRRGRHCGRRYVCSRRPVPGGAAWPGACWRRALCPEHGRPADNGTRVASLRAVCDQSV
eukprot:365899-Chlamydomonas_euryale.AAC.3